MARDSLRGYTIKDILGIIVGTVYGVSKYVCCEMWGWGGLAYTNQNTFITTYSCKLMYLFRLNVLLFKSFAVKNHCTTNLFFPFMSTDFKHVALDWSFHENCLFCCLRRSKVKVRVLFFYIYNIYLGGVFSFKCKRSPCYL